MLQLNFTGKNIEVTDALKDVTTTKFKTLEKHSSHITKVHVVFEVDRITNVAEATLHLDGIEIHATAKDNKNMYNAIDALVDKLITQITKHKEKIIDSHHHRQ